MRIYPLLFLFAIAASAQLKITTSVAPVATQYQSYRTTLTATGGTPPYTWSVVNSTGTGLPEGMTLNAATGAVSATQVNGQGGYRVTMQVTDSASPSPAVATAQVDFGVNSDTSLGGCQMFPPDSIYNQRVDQLPVDTIPPTGFRPPT
ncbi:MAG: Ig domain-containing protein [Ignavibacteriota bacterium]